MILAVALVAAVGGMFVGGTKAPEEVADAPAPPPRPAKERSPPAHPRSWQDRYRAEHPDLLVGSPDVRFLTPSSDRARVRRLPRGSTLRRDGLIWTPERLAEAEAPPVEDEARNVTTPTYDGVRPSPVTGRIIPMVEILSVPTGARVSIDGTVVGLTPFARARPEGFDEARVDLELDGYLPVTGELTPTPGGHLRFGAKLERDPSDAPASR